jgi:hypothetical protein
MSKSNKKKKKKEKITYIDDGSTIADMSALDGGRRTMNIGERGGAKERWQTYKRAVRQMFKPMLVTMGAICVIFLILYLLFELAA